MEKRQLGSSDLIVSRIGLGTWAISGWGWGGTDEADAVRTIQAAFDKGINLIDTAPAYGYGRAEEIVGRALKTWGKRDNVIVATKVGLEWNTEQTALWRNSSRTRILQEVDESLRRLGVDQIDLYQIHWPDPNTSIEETAQTMLELYQSGKIRAIGVSNFNVEQMESWKEIAPLHSNQLQLNLFQTHHLDLEIDYCHRNKIGTLTWGTLVHGLLTGKYSLDSRFPAGDFRAQSLLFKGERFRQYLEVVDRLKKLAKERGRTAAQVSVRWALDEPGVTSVLWGARRPDQLIDAVEADEWSLSKEELDCIRDIVRSIVTAPPVLPGSPPPRST